MTIIGKTNIDINIDVKLLFSFFLGAGSFSTPPALDFILINFNKLQWFR